MDMQVWDHVYLQYDFGKVRDVKQIDLYRNTYDKSEFLISKM